MAQPDYYQVLGIGRNASSYAVKAAYRRKAKLLHPDAGGDPEEFRILKLAHDVLADPDRRATYDAELDHPAEIVQVDERALTRAIRDIFLAALTEVDKPELQDIVLLMRAEANQKISAVTEQINGDSTALQAMAGILVRLHARDGSDLLQRTIVAEHQALAVRLANAKAERTAYEKALAVLDSYQYDVDGFYRYVSIDP